MTTPEAWRRGQLLLRGFYGAEVGASILELDLLVLHKERVALATIERENTLAMIGQMLQITTTVENVETRAKLLQCVEERWEIGLTERRVKRSQEEDRQIIDSLSRVLRVQRVGGQTVGQWVEAARHPEPR